jgi:hypothetical protein
VEELGVGSSSETLLITSATASSTEMASSERLEKHRRALTNLRATFALFAMMAPRLPKVRGGKTVVPSRNEEVAATKGFPAVSIFQPIVTQQELSLDTTESRTSGFSGCFSWCAAVSPLLQIFRFSRNPR